MLFRSGAKRGRSSATTFDESVFPPLKPGGEPFIEPRTGDPRHDEPRDYCMPAGFPAGMLSGNAMQFFQTKDYLVMVHEFQRMTRIIPLDGRTHRTYVEPSFYGDPVGHWEGDTLVVETTNFRDDAPFQGSSKDMRLIEKFTRLNKDVLMYEFTVNDPVFTKPWTAQLPMTPIEGPLYEYACNEGNRAMEGMLAGAREEEKKR